LSGETDATAPELFLADADRDGAIADAKAARGAKAACIQDIIGRCRSLGMQSELPSSAMEVLTKAVAGTTVHRARRTLGIEASEERDPATVNHRRMDVAVPRDAPRRLAGTQDST
jgi:hypothetical protein